MIQVIIEGYINCLEVEPIYLSALGADPISTSEPDHDPDAIYSFVKQLSENTKSNRRSNIRIYNDPDGDIAAFNSSGNKNEVHRRTEKGSYEDNLRSVIKRSQKAELDGKV